jgi:hypothetical protein
MTDRKFNRLCEPKAASGREASESQRAGQGSTEGGRGHLVRVGTRFGSVWEEIAGAAGRREIRGAGTLCGRRRRLPGDALIELEVGLGLLEEIPVRHRLGSIVPGGRIPRQHQQ